MFYYLLTSVVSIIEKALNNKNYELGNPLNWKQAITTIVLGEFVRTCISAVLVTMFLP